MADFVLLRKREENDSANFLGNCRDIDAGERILRLGGLMEDNVREIVKQILDGEMVDLHLSEEELVLFDKIMKEEKELLKK